MELWYTEKQTANHGITTKINRTLHTEQTPYQRLDVIETKQFGNMLVLDGMVMTTDVDEFVYHEMIVHVAMNTHPNPRHVLVVGGGDGGAIREILKHPSVEKATLVEIDGAVIAASKRFFPAIAGKLDDPRVEVRIEDGIQHIAESRNRYDVILVDSTEPVGPAVGLFEKGFYQASLRRSGKTACSWPKPSRRGSTLISFAACSETSRAFSPSRGCIWPAFRRTRAGCGASPSAPSATIRSRSMRPRSAPSTRSITRLRCTAPPSACPSLSPT